ncbi:hypothetical protein F7725_000149 [Dissostichus mawsoni]|uniref:HAT C-terminal dimerisation domain-containing protein n=1 Tax=Dissostichus mawsoni TaxID=36200 RepID=A0A7J5ZDJ8_DISMA|nr:hypothetical protein F7725_000149 [Dissostichus mawsoni]
MDPKTHERDAEKPQEEHGYRMDVELAAYLEEIKRATAASLRVAWILGKNKRPFTDAETVKECMLASIEEVVADEKIRKSVIDSIKNIPISDTSTSRRVETLASDVFEILLDKLRKAEVMSLAIDESTDSSDVAQLCLYVRFFDGECFREDLLGLIPLDGHTTGEVMFHKVVSFFKEHKLGLDRINMLVTDGAPAMSGRTQGLSARLADVAPQLRSLHCLIHQSLLCAKLSGDDIFQHLNQLNLELQGRDKMVTQLVERLHAFQKKLTLFSTDLCPGKMLHFPTLRTAGLQITEVMTGFMDALKTNFAARFEHFSLPTEVMRFVKDPFSVNVEGEFALKAKELIVTLNEASLQLELIDIQSSDDLRQSFQLAGSEKFWTHEVSHEKFPHSRGLALFVLTMFGSTYTCESAFSHMNAIKTNNRASLTDQHLHHCMRIAMTTYTPDFPALAKSKKCHFSH